MRHPTIRAVHSYWLRLAAGRPAPARTDLNPRDLAPMLAHVFLLDSAETGYAFRLAGSQIGERTGFDVTLSPFCALFSASSQPNAAQAVATAGVEGEPLLIGLRLATPSPSRAAPADPVLRLPVDLARAAAERRAHAENSGEMILLPLHHGGQLGTRILGAAAFFSIARERPAEPIMLEITGTRALGRSAQPVSGAALLPGFVASQVVRRKAHLSLIDGNIPPQ